jgi:hypothetical protein
MSILRTCPDASFVGAELLDDLSVEVGGRRGHRAPQDNGQGPIAECCPVYGGHDRGQTIAGLTIAGLTIAGLTIAIRVLPTLAPRREPPAVGQAWTPFHHARASAAFEDLHAARGLPGASQIPIDHWTFPKGPQTAVDIPSRALNRRFGELCVGTAWRRRSVCRT